jgi:hypothetical protein
MMRILKGSFFLNVGGDGLSGGVTLDSGGRESVLSLSDGSDLDNPGVNTAANAVLHFDIELGDDVGLEGLVLLQILFGRGIDDISDVKAFDGFVLGAVPTAVHAHDGLHVASVIFVPAVVSSFDGHVVVKYNKIYLLILIINPHLTATCSKLTRNTNPPTPPYPTKNHLPSLNLKICQRHQKALRKTFPGNVSKP